MDLEEGQRVLRIRERIVSNFTAEHWQEVGLLTGFSDLISGHSRLLRSLSWGDEDYSGNVLNILTRIASQDDSAFDVIEKYLDDKFEEETHYVSAKPSETKITFAPSVFEIPNTPIEPDLVAVMMPFHAGLKPVYTSIQSACTAKGYRALRADDIWENSTFIQDIFDLIFCSRIVVVDFSERNPNVMYETGIAHTLGKVVIPITQSFNDIPSDLGHHRALKYLPNDEGYRNLSNELYKRIKTIIEEK